MGKSMILSIAKTFFDQVKKKFPVDKVYLFGSYAKDNANDGSDIDVCVVSSAFGKNYSDEELELIKLAMKIDTRISPVPSNPQDIQNRWSQLAHEITTYGIQVI
jgi:predicted nucleotidyltransferase